MQRIRIDRAGSLAFHARRARSVKRNDLRVASHIFASPFPERTVRAPRFHLRSDDLPSPRAVADYKSSEKWASFAGLARARLVVAAPQPQPINVAISRAIPVIGGAFDTPVDVSRIIGEKVDARLSARPFLRSLREFWEIRNALRSRHCQ